MKELSAEVVWEPRDLWVGLYWKRDKTRRWGGIAHDWELFICLIPDRRPSPRLSHGRRGMMSEGSPCRSFVRDGGDGQPAVIVGHSPAFTNALLALRREAKRQDILVKEKYCPRCRTLDGLLIGDDEVVFRSSDGQPEPHELLQQLYVALGHEWVAQPITPKTLWERCIREVRSLADAHLDRAATLIHHLRAFHKCEDHPGDELCRVMAAVNGLSDTRNYKPEEER